MWKDWLGGAVLVIDVGELAKISRWKHKFFPVRPSYFPFSILSIVNMVIDLNFGNDISIS